MVTKQTKDDVRVGSSSLDLNSSGFVGAGYSAGTLPDKSALDF
jgi:hypothetical protein